jgi:hypothetical protein
VTTDQSTTTKPADPKVKDLPVRKLTADQEGSVKGGRAQMVREKTGNIKGPGR